MQDLCKIYVNNTFYYKNMYLHIYTHILILQYSQCFCEAVIVIIPILLKCREIK